MAAVAILLNGLPGSGKTTLGTDLAMLLGCPFLSKDAVMQPLENIAGPMIDRPTVGSIAMDTLWAMAGAVEAGVVLDAVWLPGRDEAFLQSGLARAGNPRAVEVWCEVPDDLAEERLRARRDGAQAIAWRTEHRYAVPMALGPVVRVDTSGDVDLPTLVERIAAHFV